MKRFGIARVLLIALMGLALFPGTASAAVIYVKANASGAANGASWTNAFTTIQAALTAASANDEVWVAAGTYTGTTSPIVTMKSGVGLYGGFAGTETARTGRNWTANPTIIDGANTYACVVGANNATLDGFTVQHGFSTGNGAGMHNYNVSPTVANCTFIGNKGNYGGGLDNRYNANSVITQCIFRQNTATNDGGGMFNRDCSPVISDCLFEENVGARGGGMFNQNVSITLSEQKVLRCTFLRNSATSSASMGGGGMLITGAGCKPLVDRCVFSENTSADEGGAIFTYNATLTLTRSIFSANTAYLTGGVFSEGPTTAINCLFKGNATFNPSHYGKAFYNCYSTASIINCTFTGHGGDASAGVFESYRATTAISNCVFWGNTTVNINHEEDTIVVDHCCVEGGFGGGTDIITSDPLFVDVENGNYRLQYHSPCINTGTSTNAPVDDINDVERPQGAGFDLGAYEYLGVTAWPTPGAITYGQTLNEVSLTGGTAAIAGAFSMENPTYAPAGGTYTGKILFTPADLANYEVASKTVEITVNKLTPVVNSWPTAAPLAYGLSLAGTSLSGGDANVPGIFVFADTTIIPGAGTYNAQVLFLPTATQNYTSLSHTVPVVVNKTTYAIDFDAYMTNAWQNSGLWPLAVSAGYLTGDFSLDPLDCDINGGYDITTMPVHLEPNGMLDSAEYALLSAILENTSMDLSATGGVTHAEVAAAWNKNYAQMYHDLGGGVGGPEWLLNPAPNLVPDVEYLMAGMMTIGDVDSVAFPMALFDLVVNNDSIAAIINDPNIVVPNPADYTLLKQHLAWCGDADGDGCSNLHEYQYFYPLLGRDGFITAALNPSQTPPGCAGDVMCDGAGGLLGEYFNTQTLSGGAPHTRVDNTVNFKWTDQPPMSGINTNNFSVCWSGTVIPNYSEQYTFHIRVDDGVRLWIGDQLLVNDWNGGSVRSCSGTTSAALVAGQEYPIKLEYYDHTNDGVIWLGWESASQPKKTIYEMNLRPGTGFGDRQGWIHNPDNDHYYKMTSATMSWPEGKALANTWGGSLSSINDAAENTWIWKMYMVTPGDFLLGGNDLGSDGVWVWDGNGANFWNGASDGSAAPGIYTNWRSGEPNGLTTENATLFYRNDGRWNDTAETTSHFCLVETDQVMTNEGEGEGETLSVTLAGAAAVDVHIGDTYTFSATVTGGQGEIHYQWFFEPSNSDDGKVFSVIQGASDSSFTLKNISAENAGYYKCQVLDDHTAAESNTISLHLIPGLPVLGGFLMLGMLTLILLSGGIWMLVHARHISTGRL